MIEEKKHTGRNILLFILIITLLLIGFLTIKFRPVWRDAKLLAANLDPDYLSIEGNVVLSDAFLNDTADGKDLKKLLVLEGVPEQDCDSLRIYAEVNPDILMLQGASSKAPDKWLFQLFASEHSLYFDGSLIYNAVRENLVTGNALLEAFVPVFDSPAYFSAEQLEQLFDTRLSMCGDFAPTSSVNKPEPSTYFLILLTGKHSGTTYSWTLDNAVITLDVLGLGEDAAITIHAKSENLAAALDELKVLAAKYHLPLSLNVSGISMLEGIDVTVEPYNITFPCPIEPVDQSFIDMLSIIKKFLF